MRDDGPPGGERMGDGDFRNLKAYLHVSCEYELREAFMRDGFGGLTPICLASFFGDMDLVARPGSVYTFWWSFRTHSRLPFLSREIFLSSGLEVIFTSTDSLLGWRSWVHGSSREVWVLPNYRYQQELPRLVRFYLFQTRVSIESLQSLIYGEHSSRWLEQGASRSRRPQGPFTYFHQRNYVFHLLITLHLTLHA